ncbi:oxidoreductase [Aulographum hederae CBS 113979]|uniref:Oxidoreductase n=1 Tax=Aulographum hederae CBS 113979 TaxID=1176131 RepID=A0A6G1H1E1_9PEZI|nr:oxidoreductase [Aulographum hederae CBS 113979]
MPLSLPQSPTPITIAIIGTGLIGPRHVSAVQCSPNATLLCIVDPSPSSQTVAANFSIPRYASIKSMLSSSPTVPEAAIVCTPNHTHVAVSKELLSAGIHVLVEKPISTDVTSGRSLVQHAATCHRHLLVGHHRRFNKYIVLTKQILNSASPSVNLGRIIAISGLWTLYKPPSYFDPPTDWRRERTSGGPVLINLIHDIDVLHHLFGPIVRVHAEKTISQRGHPAEEGAAVLLKFASGVVGTFLLCDAVPSPHNFEAGTGENPMIPFVGRDFYRVFGTEASLSVPEMRRTGYGGGEKSWNLPLSEEILGVEEMAAPFELQVEHFVRVIRGEVEPSCSGTEGLRAVVVCEAVRKAIESGEPVDIGEKL